jgi:antitoxin YefM
MKIMHFSEIKDGLQNLLDAAAAEDGIKVIRADGSAIVLLTLEEYNGLKEPAFLLSSPVNAAHLTKSLAELQAGQEDVKENQRTLVGQLQKSVRGDRPAGSPQRQSLGVLVSPYRQEKPAGVPHR